MALFSALQKYITKEGQPVEGASVSVKLAGSATNATLYATRDGGAKSNPFPTTANGNALCYVSPGRYDMTVTKDGDQVIFSDVEVGPMSLVGSFAEGGIITDPDQLVLDADGGQWRWGGALNYTFAPGEDPTEVAGWALWSDAPGANAKFAALAAPDSDVLVGGVEAGDISLAATNGISSARQRGLPGSFVFGFDAAADAEFSEDNESTDKLVNGNLSIGKQLFGIRRNATALSVKGNAVNKFAPEITGVTNSQELADYGSADQAAAFFDIQSSDFAAWEVIPSPSYSESGFTATLDAGEIKVGMVVKTDHTPPYWGIITGFTGSGATVDKWSRAGSPLDVLPANGTGLKINPILKLWALNANVLLVPDGKADLAAVCEFGLVNQKTPNPNNVNGVDMVLLGASTFGGTAGFLARAPGPAKWQLGFLSEGASIAALIAQGDSRAVAAVGCNIGLDYITNTPTSNNRAVSVKRGTEFTSPEVMAIDAFGRLQKMPRNLRVLTDGVTMSAEFSMYLYGDGGTINVNVPDPATPGLIDGDLIKVKVVAGSVIINGPLVAGGGLASSATLPTSVGSYDLLLVGGRWYV